MKLHPFWSIALLVIAACGVNSVDGADPTGTTGTTPDASQVPDGPTSWEAMPSSMPQLVSLGGSVLAAPKVQPIFFTGDHAMQAMIEQFLPMMAASPYWTATTSEYGVGALTILPTLVATTTPPTTDTALTTWLTGQLDGTHAGWTYDAGTIYAVFLPAGVVLTSSDGSASCQDYLAYHDEMTGKANQSIIYALMPRCTVQGPQIDDVTESLSHEIIEAVTDPLYETAPAFGDSDPDHYVWAYQPGAETGDYCEYLDNAYQPMVGTFMVQRTWSNAAAKAGHDPCVPALAEPYVAAAPVMPDTAPIQVSTTPVMTKGVIVPMGTPKTIDVLLFSDQPAADFTVSAIDIASEYNGTAAELAFQWDKTTGHNGDTLHLTITRKAAGQATLLGSEFAIVASIGGKSVSMWWSFAAN